MFFLGIYESLKILLPNLDWEKEEKTASFSAHSSYLLSAENCNFRYEYSLGNQGAAFWVIWFSLNSSVFFKAVQRHGLYFYVTWKPFKNSILFNLRYEFVDKKSIFHPSWEASGQKINFSILIYCNPWIEI